MIKSCSAKRSGDLLVSVSPFNFIKMKMSFMGTGTSEFEQEFEFEKLKPNDKKEMIWKNNVFVGKHWLLGKFKIGLNTLEKSIGHLDNIKSLNGKIQALNTNYFYFKFDFPRLFNFTFKNQEPIINSSIVFDIPPTLESVFKLNDESKKSSVSTKLFGSWNLDFKYCDVTLYPERNISTEIIDIKRKSQNTYLISVKYSNLLQEKIQACYFTVIHENDVNITNDYGFKVLQSEESFINKFQVSYTGTKKYIELPIYGGVYKPSNYRGSSSGLVKLSFE